MSARMTVSELQVSLTEKLEFGFRIYLMELRNMAKECGDYLHTSEVQRALEAEISRTAENSFGEHIPKLVKKLTSRRAMADLKPQYDDLLERRLRNRLSNAFGLSSSGKFQLESDIKDLEEEFEAARKRSVIRAFNNQKESFIDVFGARLAKGLKQIECEPALFSSLANLSENDAKKRVQSHVKDYVVPQIYRVIADVLEEMGKNWRKRIALNEYIALEGKGESSFVSDGEGEVIIFSSHS